MLNTPSTTLLFQRPEVQSAIERMVRAVSIQAQLHEDLTQEALLHLWILETARPGQTQTWYVKSCLFHIKAGLRHGRSVDAPKHAHLRETCDDPDFSDDAANYFAQEERVTSTVSALDILELLLPLLEPPHLI